MKNKIYLITLILLCVFISFNTSCLAGKRKDELENTPNLLKRCLQAFRKKPKNTPRNILLDINDNSPSNLQKSNIESLPTEIFQEICYTLSPHDIIHLSSASKTLKEQINEKFWETYLNIHNLKKWDNSTPIIKVAFAYSLFKKGKIQKAAQLGFPRAITIIKEKEIEKIHETKKVNFTEHNLRNNVIYSPFGIVPFMTPIVFRY